MNDLDALLLAAYELPADPTPRGVLADYVYDVFNDVDLAATLRGPAGVFLLGRIKQLVAETGLNPSYNLLWAAHYLLPRMKAPAPQFVPIPQAPQPPAPRRVPPRVVPWEDNLPDGGLPGRPWWGDYDPPMTWTDNTRTDGHGASGIPTPDGGTDLYNQMVWRLNNTLRNEGLLPPADAEHD